MHDADPLLNRRGLLVLGGALVVAGCRSERPVAGVRPEPVPSRPGIASGTGMWYTVQSGERLVDISRKSGVPLGELVSANNLRSTTVATGDRLWLPGATSLGWGSGDVPDHDAPIEPVEDEPPVPGKGYQLVRRSRWTKAPVKPNSNPMGEVTRITVHHTGEHAGMVGLPELEVIQRIENYHRNGKGWAAIGYHYLVGKNGHVYEGRPAQWQGAHTSGENENNLGISVIGDFQQQLPNSRQLVALTAFLDDMRAKYKVPKRRIYGHRDHGHTICPGEKLYAWVVGYRRA